MIIRNLQAEDIPEVESIYDLYWSGDFREHISKRLTLFVNHDPEIITQGFTYLIAEEKSKVVGVVGFRKCPSHMKEFARSQNPAEIYILAVKNQGVGIGTVLFENALKEIKHLGYTEIVLFSGESHQESWRFYDHLGLERAGEAISPNGEKGLIRRNLIK